MAKMDSLIPFRERAWQKTKKVAGTLKTGLVQGIEKYENYNKPENRIKRLKSQLTEENLKAKIAKAKTKRVKAQQQQSSFLTVQDWRQPQFGDDDLVPRRKKEPSLKDLMQRGY